MSEEENKFDVDKNDTEEIWQDLIGILADPPDKREKCENCQYEFNSN